MSLKFASVTLEGEELPVVLKKRSKGERLAPGRPVAAVHTIVRSNEYLRAGSDVTEIEIWYQVLDLREVVN